MDEQSLGMERQVESARKQPVSTSNAPPGKQSLRPKAEVPTMCLKEQTDLQA